MHWLWCPPVTAGVSSGRGAWECNTVTGPASWPVHLDRAPTCYPSAGECKQWCLPVPLVLKSSQLLKSSCSSPTFSMWPLLFVFQKLFISPQLSLRGIVLSIGVRSVCSWVAASSVSYTAILDPPSLCYTFFLLKTLYSHVLLHNVSVNSGPHIQWWSHKVIMDYKQKV